MTSPVPVNPVGRITSTTARYLGALDAQAAQASFAMTRTYSAIISDLGSELTALEGDIERRLAETGKVPVSWLHRQQRYQTLLVQAETRFNQYGAQLGQYLGVNQRRAIDLARKNAEALLESALPGVQSLVGTFHSMPDNVLRQIQGSLSAGSPLTELLDGFGSYGRAIIEDNLTQGIVKGLPPKQITKKILTDYADQTPYRTNLIVKTEMMRAYREANRATYAANKNLVKRWVWFAHLGRGTCSACLAMHGTKHPLDEPMGSHPACTCTMLPETKTWAELGFPDVPEVNFLDEIGDGEDFLRKADEKTQRLAFGNNGLHAEWKAGNVKLADTVRTTRTPAWGTNRTIASRQSALDAATQRKALESVVPKTPRITRLSGSLKESQDYARSIGAPTLPTTDKEAALQVLEALKRVDPNVASDAALQKRILKNYTEQLKGQVGTVDPAKATALQDAINEVYEDDLYRSIVRRHNDDTIIFRKGTSADGGGERRQGFSYIYDNKYVTEEDLRRRDPLRPGASVTTEPRGASAIIRHEYGHYLQDDVLTTEQVQNITSLFPPKDVTKEGLTTYASLNKQEGVSELFATVTDPTYDPANYPPWVVEAGVRLLGYLLP